MTFKSIRATEAQAEAAIRSEYARLYVSRVLHPLTPPDNGATRAQAIVAQRMAAVYYELARSLAESMPAIPMHRLISVRHDL
jgi:hypothetical protein